MKRYRESINPVKALYYDLQEIMFLYDGRPKNKHHQFLINKFRDIVRDGANTSMASVLGSQTTGIPQVYFGLTDNNTSTNPIEFEEEGGPAITGRDMWIHSGMSEFLNPLILNVNNPRRKFVDKWIALRLICRNKNNIVNLLSTKVGTRKYHRHE